jgi:hypothetical protein
VRLIDGFVIEDRKTDLAAAGFGRRFRRDRVARPQPEHHAGLHREHRKGWRGLDRRPAEQVGVEPRADGGTCDIEQDEIEVGHGGSPR